MQENDLIPIIVEGDRLGIGLPKNIIMRHYEEVRRNMMDYNNPEKRKSVGSNYGGFVYFVPSQCFFMHFDAPLPLQSFQRLLNDRVIKYYGISEHQGEWLPTWVYNHASIKVHPFTQKKIVCPYTKILLTAKGERLIRPRSPL